MAAQLRGGVGPRLAAFDWRDGERRVVFARGSSARLAELLAQEHFAAPELVCGGRAPEGGPWARAHRIWAGAVPELAAGLLASTRGGDLVAWGGGRVIDTAKAVAAVRGLRVCAVPTTLSGAEMTPVHRLPAGHEDAARVRPALVVADPALLAGLPSALARASAMNALAHAAEAICARGANPVGSMAALGGAALLAAGVEGGGEDALLLGSLLAAYAMGATGYGLHHVLAQSVARSCASPHAETNAALLPRTLPALARRAPAAMADLAAALGCEPAALEQRALELAGGLRLRDLGVERDCLPRAVAAALGRAELANVPPLPDAAELQAIALAAL